MKASELREKTVEDLNQLRDKLAREVMDMRFKQAVGQLSDTTAAGKMRREIAQVNTILREKQ